MQRLYLRDSMARVSRLITQGASYKRHYCDWDNKMTGKEMHDKTIKTSAGISVDSDTASLTVGKHGPVLIQDTHLLEVLTHFNRERIPERVVHAKGAGATGTFKAAEICGISSLCRANVFMPGTETDIVARFSTVGGRAGSADTVRDFRGFAIKFKTTEGNWDLLTLSLPVFFINDAALLPSLIHAQKKNPVSGLMDRNMFWDFVGKRPETYNTVVRLFSYLGIPNGYRYMDTFGINTFKFVNDCKEIRFGRFFIKSNQSLTPKSDEYLTPAAARIIAGENPDYSNTDLYDAINKAHETPAWTLRLQVINKDVQIPDSFFDATRLWPENSPYITDMEVGTITFEENPENYFADVEQLAFKPSNLVPGIVPASKDRLLQGRLFAYRDTQVYRLGVNHAQLPTNCPIVGVQNYERDGANTLISQGEPNYYPNSFGGPEPDTSVTPPTFQVDGTVQKYDPDVWPKDQVSDFWKSLNGDQQTELVNNIVEDLRQTLTAIQNQNVVRFMEANGDLGMRIAAGLLDHPTKMDPEN